MVSGTPVTVALGADLRHTQRADPFSGLHRSAVCAGWGVLARRRAGPPDLTVLAQEVAELESPPPLSILAMSAVTVLAGMAKPRPTEPELDEAPEEE